MENTIVPMPEKNQLDVRLEVIKQIKSRKLSALEICFVHFLHPVRERS
jgi:hypothetical protein